MKIAKVKYKDSHGKATAGAANDGDVLIGVKLGRKGAGVHIALQSKVESLYKDEILKVVRKKLKEQGVTDISIEINDRGALDYVLNARLETAVLRATRAGK